MNQKSPEFQLIHDFFALQAGIALNNNPSSGVVVGIGDDCAVLTPARDRQQVISVDTSIADRHFPADANAYDIAYRALNVALSDLAAMGATPRWFTLALTLNHNNPQWLQAFSAGLFQAASNANVLLIGGDTTKVPAPAPVSISVQVHGDVIPHKALLRSGAQAGDTLYVTGTLGDAAAGLACYQNGENNAALLAAYLRPEPQINSGLALIDVASSCMDISDGLLADLTHILQASAPHPAAALGAKLDLDSIPLSCALQQSVTPEQALTHALTGGDDYQLLFTSALAPAELIQTLHNDGQAGLVNITAIGSITHESGLMFINGPDEFDTPLTQQGFDHFNGTSI